MKEILVLALFLNFHQGLSASETSFEDIVSWETNGISELRYKTLLSPRNGKCLNPDSSVHHTGSISVKSVKAVSSLLPEFPRIDEYHFVLADVDHTDESIRHRNQISNYPQVYDLHSRVSLSIEDFDVSFGLHAKDVYMLIKSKHPQSCAELNTMGIFACGAEEISVAKGQVLVACFYRPSN